MGSRRIRCQDVLAILRKNSDDFKTLYGVTKIGVFGSVARDQATPGSDVDIVVEMDVPDLFYLVHIKQKLESDLHCSVDIVHYRKRMNAFLKNEINREAVYA